jgi:hypothetical protein
LKVKSILTSKLKSIYKIRVSSERSWRCFRSNFTINDRR